MHYIPRSRLRFPLSAEVPPDGIGLILGVDRFLDMCRTTLNVAGDLAASVVVSRGESDGAMGAQAKSTGLT